MPSVFMSTFIVYIHAKSNLVAKMPFGYTETKQGESFVRVALRVAMEMEATDEEWRDFIHRFNENQKLGGRVNA